MLPAQRFGDEWDGASAASAEQDRRDGHPSGIVPFGGDGGALRDRGAGVANLAVVDVLLFAVGDVPALEHFVRTAGADDVNHHNDATRKPLSAMAAKDFIAAALVCCA